MSSFRGETLSSWREFTDAAEFLSSHNWVFRGHQDAVWAPETSFEREFGQAVHRELPILWHFVRSAPRLIPGHLVPHENDVAAWLGLIQHYGGPTRLLDVTRSPFVALFFAFETTGRQDRALWAFDHVWCMTRCAQIMAEAEAGDFDQAFGRTAGAQAQLVASLVYGRPYRDRLFATFKPFQGVFPVDPWKPDARQSAQQAMFLCAADAGLTFADNLRCLGQQSVTTLYRFVLPGGLRDEIVDRLATMNVTAATLFPDLGGLARSLRTLTVRRPAPASFEPPWERKDPS